MAAKLNRTADTLMKILDKEKVKKKIQTQFIIHNSPYRYTMSIRSINTPLYLP